MKCPRPNWSSLLKLNNGTYSLQLEHSECLSVLLNKLPRGEYTYRSYCDVQEVNDARKNIDQSNISCFLLRWKNYLNVNYVLNAFPSELLISHDTVQLLLKFFHFTLERIMFSNHFFDTGGYCFESKGRTARRTATSCIHVTCSVPEIRLLY